MTRENQEILKRINMRKPEYSVQQWARDWEENQQFMDNISAFPKDWWLEEVGVQPFAVGGVDLTIRISSSGVSSVGLHCLVFIILGGAITRFLLSSVSSLGLHCLECHHLVFIMGCVCMGGGSSFCYLSTIIRFSSSWTSSPGFYNLGYHHQVFIITGAITRFYNLGHHHQIFIT